MIRPPEKISVILYEYPFNERIRTYLRLEHLFRRLRVLVSRDDAIDHHYALTTLFEVMDVGARADLKSDVLKDLDKQKQILNGYRGNPAIDPHPTLFDQANVATRPLPRAFWTRLSADWISVFLPSTVFLEKQASH